MDRLPKAWVEASCRRIISLSAVLAIKIRWNTEPSWNCSRSTSPVDVLPPTRCSAKLRKREDRNSKFSGTSPSKFPFIRTHSSPSAAGNRCAGGCPGLGNAQCGGRAQLGEPGGFATARDVVVRPTDGNPRQVVAIGACGIRFNRSSATRPSGQQQFGSGPARRLSENSGVDVRHLIAVVGRNPRPLGPPEYVS